MLIHRNNSIVSDGQDAAQKSKSSSSSSDSSSSKTSSDSKGSGKNLGKVGVQTPLAAPADILDVSSSSSGAVAAVSSSVQESVGPINRNNQTWRGARFTLVFAPGEIDREDHSNAVGWEVTCACPIQHGLCRKRMHFKTHGGREILERIGLSNSNSNSQ